VPVFREKRSRGRHRSDRVGASGESPRRRRLARLRGSPSRHGPGGFFGPGAMFRQNSMVDPSRSAEFQLLQRNDVKNEILLDQMQQEQIGAAQQTVQQSARSRAERRHLQAAVIEQPS